MKTQQLFFYVITLLAFSMLQSCTKEICEEHTPVDTYYKMSEVDKSKILFTGTDTLVFISTDGDTAVLYGQGKKAYFNQVVQTISENPSCPKFDYNYFENIELTFTGRNPDLNYIFIDFSASGYGPQYSEANITIGEAKYSAYFGRLHNSSNYIDSVNINSITYTGRKIFDESNLLFLYNYQFGFLQIVTPNRVWLQQL